MFHLDPKQTIQERFAGEAPNMRKDVELSELARKVAAQPVEKTIPPALIVGSVQVVETLSLIFLGLFIYWAQADI
ncbi:MAG TPA: hypothetical protein ENJ68_01625, partial [Devosia sp.]|nr:hypothetical protein [Devosia sp.]